jgi:hypothetical protein
MSFVGNKASSLTVFSVFLLSCSGCVSLPVEAPEPPPGSIPIICTVDDANETGEKDICLGFIPGECVSEFLTKNLDMLGLKKGQKEIWIARPKLLNLTDDEILPVFWDEIDRTVNPITDFVLRPNDRICVTKRIQLEGGGKLCKVYYWTSLYRRIASFLD